MANASGTPTPKVYKRESTPGVYESITKDYLDSLENKDLQPLFRKVAKTGGAFGAHADKQTIYDILLGLYPIEQYELSQSAETGWKTKILRRGAPASLKPEDFVATPTTIDIEKSHQSAAVINKIIRALSEFSPERARELEAAKDSLLGDMVTYHSNVEALKVQLATLAANPPAPAVSAPPAKAQVVDLGNGMVEILGIKCPTILKQGDPGYEWVPEIDPNFDLTAWTSATKLTNGTTFYQGAKQILMLMLDSVPTHLWGPPATGKTEVIRQLCAMMKWPLIVMTGRKNFDESLFFGSYQASPGKGTYWQDGMLPLAMKIGAVFLANEVDYFPSHCTNALNAMLDDLVAHRTVKLLIPEASLEVLAKPTFRVMCDSNTNLQGDDSGLFVGTQVQNAAFISRLGASLHSDYLTPEQESRIIVSKTGISKADAALIVKVAGETREAAAKELLRYPLTFRHTLSWARLYSTLGTMEDAFVSAVINKLSGNDASVIMEIAQRVMPNELSALFTTTVVNP